MVEVGGTVHIEPRATGEHTLVVIAGPLSRSTAPRIEQALVLLLAAGRPVLVDLSAVDLGWPPAVEAFVTALRAGGGWPLARVVLFGADARLTRALHDARVTERVPLAGDEAAARVRVATPPDVVQRQVHLPESPAAGQLARATVVDACRDWSLPTRVLDAGLIADELVRNAVEHAHSAPRMTLTLRGGTLTIGVRDDLPGDPPRPQLRCVGRSGGWGLLMVAALSKRWGVTPHAGGKTVWATV